MHILESRKRLPWKNLIAAIVTLVLSFTGTALALSTSSDGLWREVKESSVALRGERQVLPKAYRTLQLNRDALAQILSRAPLEFTEAAGNANVVITLPKPDGTFARFRIQESPILSPKVAAEVPDWKSYSGQGIDDPTAVARFDWSPNGFHGYVLGMDGTYVVDPCSSGDNENYIAYYKRDAVGQSGLFHCKLDEFLANDDTHRANPVARAPSVPLAPNFSNGANLKTYRLAIATTGEYTMDRGGQAAALADVMNAVNRINTVYRRDLAVSFTLVSGTNTIFPNPNTDPYNDTDEEEQLNINQTQLDTIIGDGNYDIGHLFGTGGGGVALSPVVCAAGDKAKGYSARVPPTGDSFWVDYVAHEMGHQFSAQHTYNTLEDGTCSTRSAPDAYELASGTTIMSYVGICGDRNQQQFSLDVFHIRSLTQIIADLNNAANSGACGSTTATSNNVPVVNAGANFTIPKLTPFTLTATATDADNDTLTYSWEEYDLAPSASGPKGVPVDTYDVDTDGVKRPLFRVYAPTTSRSRTYPSLPYILNNANNPPLTFTGTSPAGANCEATETCVTAESLPSIMRTMNFRVVVRDNRAGGGGVNDDTMQVNVNAGAGPFTVTAPNTAVSVAGGSQLNVTWNVMNTAAPPVSAANVKISLSTNGGNTFPNVLIASTANDGSAAVTVPNIATSAARIKVEAVGNIFFDISDASFTITSTGGGTPTTLANISTRLLVGTADDALIGGFIVTGTQDKKVLIRAIGPSLTLAGKLANPTLELRNSSTTLLKSNDDWMNSTPAERQAIIDTQAAPTNNLESAIVATLPANTSAYTAIVRGLNNTTGTGVVEIYDLNLNVDSKLANISTRGVVQTGDTVLIAGTFVLGPGSQKVIIRVIAPSLSIAGKLQDPTLELRDGNGTLLRENDNWRIGGQEAEIIASTVAPTNNLESALIHTLPGNGASYTAIVRGVNNTTGIAVIEVYALQ